MSLARIADHPTFALIQSLQERSQSCARLARRLLWMISITIGAGILFYIYAPLIANFDNELRSTAISELESQIDRTESERRRASEGVNGIMDTIDGQVEEIRTTIERAIGTSENSYAPKPFLRTARSDYISNYEQDWSSYSAVVFRELRDNTNSETISEFASMEAILLSELRHAEEFLLRLERNPSEIARLRERRTALLDEATRPQPVLSSLTLTRIGVILLLLLLVAILNSLYRYNMKLSAFYASRADILILSGEWEYMHDMAEFADIFGPERIEFSRVQSPVQVVTDITKEVINKLPKST